MSIGLAPFVVTPHHVVHNLAGVGFMGLGHQDAVGGGGAPDRRGALPGQRRGRRRRRLGVSQEDFRGRSGRALSHIEVGQGLLVELGLVGGRRLDQGGWKPDVLVLRDLLGGLLGGLLRGGGIPGRNGGRNV